MLVGASRRPLKPSQQIASQQIRHATLIRRPKRPYTFTQLITLSDGSTFTHRTTSPQPIYSSTKDTKNNPLWNPSSQKLLNVEEDEAGRLRKFRERFGRGFDIEASSAAEQDSPGNEGSRVEQEEVNLLDLISGYNRADDKSSTARQEKQNSKSKEK